MKPTPYIGITDFSTSEQVEKMTKFFKERNQGLQHFLHVGVMSSWKSLNGIPTKFDDVWPKKEHLSHVFMERIARDPVFACLHYADYDIRSRGETWKTILRGLEASGVWLDGLQLDMVWPDFAEIDTALTMHRYPIKVILQVNSLAFDLMDNDPKKVVEKLDEYRAFLSYVLLDKSMRKGHPLDSEFLLPFIREINQQIPDLGIVVAGGLGPGTLHLLEPILQEFPDISIDAQGRLRHSGDSKTPIDWELAEVYIQGATDLFRKYKK